MMAKIFVTAVAAVILVMYWRAWRSNPNRRKNIDANVRSIVNASAGTTLVIEQASAELEKEYNHQLRGYPGNIKCYRDRNNRHAIVLSKS